MILECYDMSCDFRCNMQHASNEFKKNDIKRTRNSRVAKAILSSYCFVLSFVIYTILIVLELIDNLQL